MIEAIMMIFVWMGLLADHVRHRNAKLEIGKHARKG